MAVETIQWLGDLIKKDETEVAIEPVNRAETFFVRTAGKAKEFCEDVGHPCIGVMDDTFHSNIEKKSIPAAATCWNSI